MFLRKIGVELRKWAESVARKPLLLCGARKVGKTTAVDVFAAEFESYISLNLGQASDRAIFANGSSPAHTLNFWARDKSQSTAEVTDVLPINGHLI